MMLSTDQQLGVMLADALHQTITNPTASHRWHTLLNLCLTEANDAQRAAVQEHILAQLTHSDEVGFFRETFLAALTRDVRYSAQAGQLLMGLRPIDADRVVAFSVYEWGRQVLGSGGLQQFTSAMRAACVPDLMSLIGQQLLAFSPTFSPTARQFDRGLTKIALVMPFVSHANHPPTVLALQQARLLSESGLQVAMFSCQELRVQHMADYLGSNGQLLTPSPHLDTLRPLIPDGVNLTLCDERFSLMRRYRDLLVSIADFDPDLVLFVGLNSPLMTPLHAARPTLGLCIHAVQPMVPVDVWLTSSLSCSNQLGGEWGNAFPTAWGHYHPYRIALQPTEGSTTRAKLGLPSEGVVLVTVGARLATEITGTWGSSMVSFLTMNPGITWLLVGGDGNMPSALADVAGQLRILPHQKDIRSVLRCTDIYVNPERLGGGFSIAEAMAEGLAVVALADSDGGNKLDSAAAANREDFFAKLNTLVNNATARQQMGRAMQTRFTKDLDMNHSGSALISACHLTLERYHQRLS